MDNIKLDAIDQSFDKFTPFTFLSSVTGTGRAIFGLVELIYGVAGSIIFGIGQLFSNDTTLEKNFDNACIHLFFGGANIVKGVFEAIPGINLLVWCYNMNEDEGLKRLFRADWYSNQYKLTT